MTNAIAITIGSQNGHIIARANHNAEKTGRIQLMDFVRIGRVIGRIVRIEDAHDFGSDTEISKIAGICLSNGREPGMDTKNNLYKRTHIEPLGEILPGGELSEYTGGIGYFETVTQTNGFDIARLYPCSNGITIGNVASGWKTTQVPFMLSLDNALSRHMLVVGKNGSGKTNFLKELIASNVSREEPVAMLVFGHPDLGADNPNDQGTRGVTALENDSSDPDKDLQLTAYSYVMAREGHDIEDVILRFDVLMKNGSYKFLNYSTTRTHQDLAHLFKIAKSVINGIKAGCFYPVESWRCNGCVFSEYCQKW